MRKPKEENNQKNKQVHTKEEKKAWHVLNKAKKTEYRKTTRRVRKAALIEYKGGQCVDCGEKYDGNNSCIFDFHHLRDKHFNISGNTLEKSLLKLKREADKCTLMCSNCHRREHAEGEY